MCVCVVHPAKMPRRDLTLAEKIQFLDQIKQQPNTTHRRLVEITGLAKTTIARLMKQEKELREEWARCDRVGASFSQKRKREGKDPIVDEALSEWFATATERGVQVNGPILKYKAEQLAKDLGHVNFKATDGWLSRWKSRNDIRFKKRPGEKESFGTGTGEWQSKKLLELLDQFPAEEIYNADETGLYYRATPDGSLSFEHDAVSSFDSATDRITVLCCSNMSGTDKRKLLVVGKTPKPPCFKGLRMDSLPVLYRANKNAWMTSEIFTEWLKDWDRRLQLQSRKILLLLDNCPAHPRLDCLKNVTLEFLPPRTTALVRPMDMGIIKNLKTSYRARLVNHILETIEEGLLTSSSTAREVGATVNLLHAVTFVADSWRKISSETIQSCFSLCGFKNRMMDSKVSKLIEDGNGDGIAELQHVKNYEEFLSVDVDLQCCDENPDYDAAIVAKIAKKYSTPSKDEEKDENALSQTSQVTTREARKCVETLRRYFMQDGNEGSPMHELDVCNDFVQLQSVKKIRQKNS